jgi:hypothetical protein
MNENGMMFGHICAPRDLYDRVRKLSAFCFCCSSLDILNMPGDEKLRKDHEESDSDEEEVVETIPQIDIDVSKLTPLSPEVISKQVSADRSRFSLPFLRILPRLP